MKIKDENNTFQVFRFGQKRYTEAFARGYFSFSCPGAYITQAIETGNNEQGDRFEAVFARLRKTDPRIEKMKEQLHEDLEIIEDGEYVLLRRYSARLIPVFCFFNYKISDLREGELGEYKDGTILVKMKFDPKMYSGFESENASDEEKLILIYIDAVAFTNKVEGFLKTPQGKNANARMSEVDYKERGNDTFFIEPTENYDELKYKRPRYKYQHEGRIYFPQCRFISEKDRYTLFAGAFEKNQIYIFESLPSAFTFCCSGRKAEKGD